MTTNRPDSKQLFQSKDLSLSTQRHFCNHNKHVEACRGKRVQQQSQNIDLTERRLPDFIVCGAPKCGTTSLHFILNQHPDISIPDPELLFFDADDPMTHSDFFFVKDGLLRWIDVRRSAHEGWNAYLKNLEELPPTKFTGEDSTTYIMSESAPIRILESLPDVKLLFMLRHPVERAYSQYWHLVKTGRLTCTFEKAIFEQRSIILGSTYSSHIQRYIDLFGRDRILVETLESLKRDTQATMNRVTDFIGAERIDTQSAQTWFNKTYYPSSLSGQLALNQIGKHFVRLRYYNHSRGKEGLGGKIARKLHHLWFQGPSEIFLKRTTPLPMKPETKAYLLQHLSARNAGLSNLLGFDFTSIWDGMDC